MHLVDHQFVVGREHEVVALPIEFQIVHHSAVRRMGHLAGIGIDPLKGSIRRDETEFVALARACPGHVGIPIAVALLLQGIGRI